MKNFEELGITPGILKAIRELGFETPMAVQESVIPLMLGDDCDIIALAQTGTGKTAAFGLPLVLSTDTELNSPQTLILCPTRELCMQITGDLKDYARYAGGLKILAVYGGASIENQINALKKGVHIVVATPGRLIDLINRRAAKLASVSTVILDEADEMLNMGFLDSINEILEEVPEGRRTLLFSATMSAEIAGIAKRYMNDPKEITIGTRNASAANVSHGYYLVNSKDKYRVLKRIADSEPNVYGIIFCRTRRETQEIASMLIEDGYNADALHGDLSQVQRDTVMQKFRVRNLQLLVATDVAARGLDVDDLTHVINYTLPDDTEVYTHRSGRTGRAGKKGISISLISPREKNNLRQVEKLIKKPINAIPIPSGKEICGKQLFHYIKRLETVATEHQEIEKLLPEISRKLADLDRDELLRRVVSLQFDKFLDDYRSGEDIFSPDDRNDSFRKSGKESKPGDYKRLFINLGKTDGFFPEQLIELVNKSTPGKKIPIGKIDLLKTFSFFEVLNEHADLMIEALNNKMFMERRVAVEIAQEKGEKERGDETRKSKWSDRRPARRKDKEPARWEKKNKKDKKFSKKDKKKYGKH
jgi:ATP-dependent RNA helicase DeaD